MADTVTSRWIYPPNWDGSYPAHKTDGHNRMVKTFACISDGTGETNVKKVDISEIRCSNGQEAKRTVIERIDYDCRGFTSLQLHWDRNPDEVIAVFGGDEGGCMFGPFTDPGGEQSGDILLTTAGASSGDTYMITIYFRVKPK